MPHPCPALLARERGFVKSSHVTWLGKAGWKDWELKGFILENDWTFVTRNSVDFRGPIDAPGSAGQYANVPLQAGLICINGPEHMTARTEVRLFDLVLSLHGTTQTLNEVIVVILAEDGDQYEVARYTLP